MQPEQPEKIEFEPHPWALRQVVMESGYVRSRRFAGAKEPGPNIGISVDIPIAVSEDRRNLLVRFRLQTRDEHQPYDIDLVWAAEFDISPEATDEQIVGFASTTGAFVLWPYIRTQAADLTSKMGYPQFLLPVVIFNEAFSAANEALGRGQPEGESQPS